LARRKVTNEERLDEIENVALELYEKYKAVKIEVVTPNYSIKVNRPIEELEIDRYSFNEAHRYLKNAKRRIKTKTPEGYSDCKANCRNALDSILQTLTGKEKVREATRELINQGMLGERESEFTGNLEKLIVTLHGLDSKKGSHPPMTRSENDAKLALNLTRDIVEYIINQATQPRV